VRRRVTHFIFPRFDFFIARRDDTLLCSTFLSSKGLRLDSDPAKVREMESQLTELSHSIIAVLSLALQVSEMARFFDI
jgi:hypothetical protein